MTIQAIGATKCNELSMALLSFFVSDHNKKSTALCDAYLVVQWRGGVATREVAHGLRRKVRAEAHHGGALVPERRAVLFCRHALGRIVTEVDVGLHAHQQAARQQFSGATMGNGYDEQVAAVVEAARPAALWHTCREDFCRASMCSECEASTAQAQLSAHALTSPALPRNTNCSSSGRDMLGILPPSIFVLQCASLHLRDASGALVQRPHSPCERLPQHLHLLLVAGDQHPDPVLGVRRAHERQCRPVHLRQDQLNMLDRPVQPSNKGESLRV